VVAGADAGRVTVFRTAPDRLAAELDANETWRVQPADPDATPVVYPQAVDVSGSTRLLAIGSPMYELLELQWPLGSVPIPNAYGLDPPFVAVGDEVGRLHVFVHGWSPGDGHMVCYLHETDNGWASKVICAVGRQEDAQYPPNLALSACRASDGTLAVGFADPYGGAVYCAFLREQRWQVHQVAKAELVPATAVLWRGGKAWLAYLDLSRGRARLVVCGPEGE
jgi:hypothetical protein